VDFGAGSSESDWDDDDGAVFAKIIQGEEA